MDERGLYRQPPAGADAAPFTQTKNWDINFGGDITMNDLLTNVWTIWVPPAVGKGQAAASRSSTGTK